PLWRHEIHLVWRTNARRRFDYQINHPARGQVHKDILNPAERFVGLANQALTQELCRIEKLTLLFYPRSRRRDPKITEGLLKGLRELSGGGRLATWRVLEGIFTHL